MTGGTSNGSALAWAIYLSIIGGGVSGFVYVVERWRSHLPKRLREWLDQDGDL